MLRYTFLKGVVPDDGKPGKIGPGLLRLPGRVHLLVVGLGLQGGIIG